MQKKAAPTDSQWTEITQLLDSWFERGFTRQCLLPYESQKISHTGAQLAASLYKRGVRAIKDLTTNTVHEVLFSNTGQQSNTEHVPVHYYKSIDEFFDLTPDLNSTATVLCDSAVLQLHPMMSERFESKKIKPLVFQSSEENKQLSSIIRILESIPTKPDHLFAIGGGICCDVGGLVGHLLNAQVHLVPTTLLAMADAGIGGKTGVNHPRAGKNQIGRFITLGSMSVVTEILTTLPPSEIRQGIAEVGKHLFLCGSFPHWEPFLKQLAINPSGATFSEERFIDLLKLNIEFKEQIVRRDPLDNSLRNMLNFGHTAAHLLETLQAQGCPLTGETSPHATISHGIAVALGLLVLIDSKTIKEAPSSFGSFLKQLLQAEGVQTPLVLPPEYRHTAEQILVQDKKAIHKDMPCLRIVTPAYGALKDIEEIEDIDGFMKKNTLELSANEFLSIIDKSGVMT